MKDMSDTTRQFEHFLLRRLSNIRPTSDMFSFRNVGKKIVHSGHISSSRVHI